MLVFVLLILSAAYFIYYRQKTKTRQLEQDSKLQRILAEQKTQKQLSEQRNRISSDLHNNIGAQLTFIVSSLNNLKYIELTKEVMSTKIDQISSFTVVTINELRDTIWDINKNNISMEDLQIRLANLISKANLSCLEIEFELIIHPDVEGNFLLNSMEGINYYRIAQEALNNAIKHSGADKIKIIFSKHNDNIKVCIKHNGKGIKENSFGNGLGTMRNRAARISRELSIDSQQEGGTQVCIF